ncbi:MAG: GNAT family N-acetyltransferase [Erysipelotrichaceae bacterium]|nr:GNAT family N-acetyltransferase [Erysipelotrichaceae bacterium]
MSSKNYELKPLQWDTDYFGVSSARVNLYGIVSEKEQEEIVNFCKEYEFLTICNIDNVIENNHWISKKTDAFLVDVNLQYQKRIESNFRFISPDTYIANCLSKNNRISDIAINTFKHSRFFNDPFLPKYQTSNIYHHWTESAFNNKKKYFIIHEKAGLITGFILFSLSNSNSIIELIAVDEKYQGQGIGKKLINTLESYTANMRLKHIDVGTQSSNTTAVLFYQKMGFMYVGCRSIYHLWI